MLNESAATYSLSYRTVPIKLTKSEGLLTGERITRGRDLGCVCVVKNGVGFLLAAQPQEVGSLPLNRAAGTSRIRAREKEQGNETGWSKGAGVTCDVLSHHVCRWIRLKL